MKTAVASEIKAAEPPIWNRIRKTREFLTKLSLNAEKNWHQNKGAKRRVIRREDDMGSYGKRPSRPWLSALYKRQFGQKDNIPGVLPAGQLCFQRGAAGGIIELGI